ncbi:MAG: hypothetical protein L3J69_10845 [Desulfobacula sp.]|nr:hypothetical protein [Desulfobacula sp.]
MSIHEVKNIDSFNHPSSIISYSANYVIIKKLLLFKPFNDSCHIIGSAHFGDKKEVELVWNGKTGDVCNIVLSFQVIEQVDEPRAEENRALQMDIFDQQTGRQITGWNNKLIWGDNKLILSSLKNGPLREEIEAQGGIKLNSA